MKALFIYNPAVAKKSFTDFLDYIIGEFQSHDYQLIFHRFHELQSLEEAIIRLSKDQGDFSKVIIAGDETTINKVVNLLVQYDVDLDLGIYPVGSFNSFTNQLGLNGSIVWQTNVILKGSPISCDVGYCNGTYFMNALSIGVFSKAIPVKIETPSQTYYSKSHMILVLNTQGSGIQNVGGHVCFRDGLLDVYLIKKRTALKFINFILDSMGRNFKTASHIDTFRTNELVVKAPKGTVMDVNGSKISNFPFHIKLIPNKIKVMVASDFEQNEYRKNNFLPNHVNTKAKAQMPSPFDLADVIMNIPHQHTFFYGNRRTLSPEYFKQCKKNMKEPYLYIVFSNTGSPACNLVSILTRQKYGHISLAFDKELKTLASFNGGYGKYKPGLNPEPLKVLYQKQDASIMIFRIKVNEDQKRTILTEMRHINRVGSSYNFTGLFLKRNFRRNIMFCSQFVYTMLHKAGLLYFEKNPNDVAPIDFLQNNEQGHLEFLEEVYLKDFIE